MQRVFCLTSRERHVHVRLRVTTPRQLVATPLLRMFKWRGLALDLWRAHDKNR
jgi:hypothetical protein